MLRRVSHREDDAHFWIKALDVLRSKVSGRLKREPVESSCQNILLWQKLFKTTIRIGLSLPDQLPAMLYRLNLKHNGHAARRTAP